MGNNTGNIPLSNNGMYISGDHYLFVCLWNFIKVDKNLTNPQVLLVSYPLDKKDFRRPPEDSCGLSKCYLQALTLLLDTLYRSLYIFIVGNQYPPDKVHGHRPEGPTYKYGLSWHCFQPKYSIPLNLTDGYKKGSRIINSFR